MRRHNLIRRFVQIVGQIVNVRSLSPIAIITYLYRLTFKVNRIPHQIRPNIFSVLIYIGTARYGIHLSRRI